MPDGNKSLKTSKAPPTTGWDPAALIDASQLAFKCWAHAVSALSEEMGQFVQSRLQEDLSIWTKLTTCKDPGQAFECQRMFVQKATTDYLDEFNKLSRLTMNIASEAFSTLQGAAQEPHRS